MPSSSPQALFTPKQVAVALGVSESSIKRWCDSGRIRSARTAGGHRKLPMWSVVDLVRETGHEIVDPTALGMVAISSRRAPAQVQDDLYKALMSGDEPAARELLLGLYQSGSPVVELGDELVGPVFRRIGYGWESGDVTVHQERRSCSIVTAVLHELRRWMPPAPADAPLALTATPQRDFADVPIRLVELLLQSKGWRTVMAGAGLPVAEILGAIEQYQPQLICLSATHLEDVDAYVQEHNESFGDGAVKAPIIIGGGAFSPEQAQALSGNLFAGRLTDLAAWLNAETSHLTAPTRNEATDGDG